MFASLRAMDVGGCSGGLALVLRRGFRAIAFMTSWVGVMTRVLLGSQLHQA